MTSFEWMTDKFVLFADNLKTEEAVEMSSTINIIERGASYKVQPDSVSNGVHANGATYSVALGTKPTPEPAEDSQSVRSIKKPSRSVSAAHCTRRIQQTREVHTEVDHVLGFDMTSKYFIVFVSETFFQDAGGDCVHPGKHPRCDLPQPGHCGQCHFQLRPNTGASYSCLQFPLAEGFGLKMPMKVL